MISRCVRGAFVAALFAICAGANASPITFTYSGVGTGTLGGTPFTNAPFAFTFNTDTTLATVPILSVVYPAQTGIGLTVGATSTTFTPSTNPFFGFGSVTGLSDANGAFLVFGVPNLGAFDFASDFASVNATTDLVDITNRPTGAGNLTITGITRPQFTAVVAVVPDAGTFALVGLGFAVCAAKRRRAR